MTKLLSNSRVAFWLMGPHAAACEIGADIGYDIVIFDIEHGVHHLPELDTTTALCRALGLSVYWRVAEGSRREIQWALDAGAEAVLIPQIRTVEEAKVAADFSRYPPRGSRGIGHSRLNKFGGFDSNFVQRQNDTLQCIIMIETKEALGCVEEIAALPGVDGLFIGPSDLSLARGRGLNRDTEQDIADCCRAIDAAKHEKKNWSISAASEIRQRLAIELGASFFAIADDYSALLVGMRSPFDALAHRIGK